MPVADSAWVGRPAKAARLWLAAHTDWPHPCHRCGVLIERDEDWHTGHVLDRQAYPELTWDRDNWTPEHQRCSTEAGARQGNARRAPKTKRTLKTVTEMSVSRLSSGSPALPSAIFDSTTGRIKPETFSNHPREPGERDGLPRNFSEPHREAVGSLGDEFTEWVEERRGGPLRWFQWVTAQRRYEVKADGSWCWPLVFESTPRQQGKTVTLTEDAAWYCARATGPALVLHSARRIVTSRETQAELWPWAESLGYPIYRLLGDSRITWPETGAVWATVAIEGAYGRRPWRLLEDECWDIDPVHFWNSLYPALGGAPVPPQALFWSTANPDDQGLVADLQKDENVCRMEWGILDGEDAKDEEVWRRSSAFWAPGRLDLMRIASKKSGFREEWLNYWPKPADLKRWLSSELTGLTEGRVGDAPNDAVMALETSLDGSRWSVAAAWPHTRGRVRARVWNVSTAREAALLIGHRQLWCHQSVAKSPAFVRHPIRMMTMADARAATGVLRNLITEKKVKIAGLGDDTWIGVRTLPADGGEVISSPRSAVDVSGVKALSWACLAVESAREQSGSLVM